MSFLTMLFCSASKSHLLLFNVCIARFRLIGGVSFFIRASLSSIIFFFCSSNALYFGDVFFILSVICFVIDKTLSRVFLDSTSFSKSEAIFPSVSNVFILGRILLASFIIASHADACFGVNFNSGISFANLRMPTDDVRPLSFSIIRKISLSLFPPGSLSDTSLSDDIILAFSCVAMQARMSKNIFLLITGPFGNGLKSFRVSVLRCTPDERR